MSRLIWIDGSNNSHLLNCINPDSKHFINRKSKSMMLFRKLKNFYKLKSCLKHRTYFVRKKNRGFDFSVAVANMNNNTPHDFNFSQR